MLQQKVVTQKLIQYQLNPIYKHVYVEIIETFLKSIDNETCMEKLPKKIEMGNSKSS